MDRSLLFLTYLFPPRGGAGVQRALKFVKYLPQFGWRPLVVANGGAAADHVTTMQDPSLMADLPPDAVVRYTSLNDRERRHCDRLQAHWRQRFIVTDPMTWWVTSAVRAGLQLVAEHKPAAIFVTMSPFSAAQAGIALKRAAGLPLILDLRDPWALDETKIYPSRLHHWLDCRAMRHALAAADLVIMNNPQSALAVHQAFPGLPPSRIASLTNGFDGDDFARSHPQPANPAVMRIVHTGTFHSELALLWDGLSARRGFANKIKYAARPINLWTRSPRYLLAAMEQAVADGVPAERMELVLVGEISPGDRAMVEASPVASSVRMLGYRSHEESVGWLQSTDLLFLPLHTPLDGAPALIVPGKAYEYLGSGRPILAMGPPGDMRDFIIQAAAGQAVAGDDVPAAAAVLRQAFQAKQCGQPLFTPDRSRVATFERRELSRQLALMLDQVVGHGTRPADG